MFYNVFTPTVHSRKREPYNRLVQQTACPAPRRSAESEDGGYDGMYTGVGGGHLPLGTRYLVLRTLTNS